MTGLEDRVLEFVREIYETGPLRPRWRVERDLVASGEDPAGVRAAVDRLIGAGLLAEQPGYGTRLLTGAAAGVPWGGFPRWSASGVCDACGSARHPVAVCPRLWGEPE